MIISIGVFFLVLTVLVLIHELGHFLVARLNGVRVDEFGLGLPPRIWGKKIGGTIYSFNWLPIGGFVRLAGEDDDGETHTASEKSKYHDYFWAKSKKARAAILTAGVVMNFLLAVGITTFLLADGVKVPAGQVTVEKVTPGSPAAVAGLTAGDVILSGRLDLQNDNNLVLFKESRQLISYARENADRLIILTVNRQGSKLTLSLVPRKNPPEGQGPIGVTISDLVDKKYPLSEAPLEAVKVNFQTAFRMVTGVADTIWGLLTLKNTKPDIAGPIGIAKVTSDAVKFGWRAVLELAALLSLNLAVLNILPFPALDGGRLLFVFLEKILGRKIKPAFEKSTHQIGMVILLAIIALVSINDIIRLARGG
jgi:regulator of sigma E protease